MVELYMLGYRELHGNDDPQLGRSSFMEMEMVRRTQMGELAVPSITT